MKVLTELVRNVLVIILLTTFLDLLLPSSKMQRFVKVIMGLFILVSVLTPVLSIFSKGEDFAVFNWYQEPQKEGYATVLQDSNRLTAVNQELFMKNYAARVEKQMAALVRLVKGVKEAKVEVELQPGKQMGTLEGIKTVQVTLLNQLTSQTPQSSMNIKPIKIEISGESQGTAGGEKGTRQAGSTEEKRIEAEIKKTISQYFGLEIQQIKVLFE